MAEQGRQAGHVRRILVTGASGFVGRALVAALEASGQRVTAPAHSPKTAEQPSADVQAEVGWAEHLSGQDTVIHLAAFNPARWQPATEGRHDAITRDGAIRIARIAAASGVGHFVFVSSARVYGLPRPGQTAFSETDAPNPSDPYGRAKAEAEAGIAQALAGSAMRLTILRPPVIHARDHGGSVGLIARMSRLGLPLPLTRAASAAPKSVLGLPGLVVGLERIAASRSGFEGTFNIADPEPVSFGDIARLVARANDRSGPHFMPEALARIALRVLISREAVAHLEAPIVLETSRISAQAGWPPLPATSDALGRSFAPATSRMSRASGTD